MGGNYGRKKQRKFTKQALRAIFGIEHIPRKILIMIVLGLSLIAMLVVCWQTSTIFPIKLRLRLKHIVELLQQLPITMR